MLNYFFQPGNYREAFIKKNTKKLKKFNLGLTPPPIFGKVKKKIHFVLKLDHICSTFGKNYFFPRWMWKTKIGKILEITPENGYIDLRNNFYIDRTLGTRLTWLVWKSHRHRVSNSKRAPFFLPKKRISRKWRFLFHLYLYTYISTREAK